MIEQPLSFSRRASVETTDVYRRRIWRSACGRYRVSEFIRLDGTRVYYAERSYVRLFDARTAWDVLSRHKRRSTAERSCQRDAAHQDSLPTLRSLRGIATLKRRHG